MKSDHDPELDGTLIALAVVYAVALIGAVIILATAI